MTIRPGEFWVAEFRFTGLSDSKKRPVLVLWLDAADAVVAAVTTAQPRSQFNVALVDWKTSGLRRESVFRLSRLDCLEQSLPIARIGVISSNDGDVIKRTWSKQIKPRF